MRKKSMVTRTAAVFTAAALSVAASGCGVKEQSENTSGVQSDVAVGGSSDETQKDAADSSGKGRYVESTVYESSGFSDFVWTQILDDGQIIFLNCLTKQKVVSTDGGSTWEAESNDAFYDFVGEHYAVGAAIAKDGTIAMSGWTVQEVSRMEGMNIVTICTFTIRTIPQNRYRSNCRIRIPVWDVWRLTIRECSTRMRQAAETSIRSMSGQGHRRSS